MALPQLRDSDALLSSDVRSFFKPAAKPGRPKKRPRGPAAAPPPYIGPPPAAATTRKTKASVVKTKKPKVKMTRTTWTLPANQEILQQVISDWLHKTGECEEHHSMREFAALCCSLAAWFDGVVEKVCTIMLKINYPDIGDWQHHDPTKWMIEKR